MYENNESYLVVKEFLINSVPHTKFIKTREENRIMAIMNHAQRLYFLNGTAMDFVKLCDGTRTLANIIEILHEQYEVEKETLTADIINLIRDMQHKRILYINPLEQTTWMKQKKD